MNPLSCGSWGGSGGGGGGVCQNLLRHRCGHGAARSIHVQGQTLNPNPPLSALCPFPVGPLPLLGHAVPQALAGRRAGKGAVGLPSGLRVCHCPAVRQLPISSPLSNPRFLLAKRGPWCPLHRGSKE